jgi:hypothetical protein
LSLICATFTWLRENEKRREAIAPEEGGEGHDAGEWSGEPRCQDAIQQLM